MPQFDTYPDTNLKIQFKDTSHKTRHRLQQLRHLNKALDLQNEKSKTEYTENSTYNTVLVLKQNIFLKSHYEIYID